MQMDWMGTGEEATRASKDEEKSGALIIPGQVKEDAMKHSLASQCNGNCLGHEL